MTSERVSDEDVQRAMDEMTSETELFRTMRDLLEGIAQIAENHGFKRGDDLQVWLSKALRRSGGVEVKADAISKSSMHQKAAVGRTIAEAERDKAVARLSRAMEVVRPFAEVGRMLCDEDGWADTDTIQIGADPEFPQFHELSAGSFRAARQFIEGEK